MIRFLTTFSLLLLGTLAHGQIHQPFAEQCVERYARHYNVPAEFIAALIDVESAWHPNAVSTAGAMGLMQLMPETAARFGALHPFDVEQNIAAGTRFVTTLMWAYHGDLRLVAAAYHANDFYIRRRQLSYSNPEVVAYVRSVRARYIARKFRSFRAHEEVGTK